MPIASSSQSCDKSIICLTICKENLSVSSFVALVKVRVVKKPGWSPEHLRNVRNKDLRHGGCSHFSLLFFDKYLPEEAAFWIFMKVFRDLLAGTWL